jgi:hypothetical protein
MRQFIVTVCVLAGLVAAVGAAQPEPIDLGDVPAKVTVAADKALPGVNWLIAKKAEQTEGDKTVTRYVVIGVQKAGKKRVVSFVSLGDGTDGVARVSVPLTEVPKAALDAVKAQNRGFLAESAMTLGSSADDVLAYRLIGKLGRGEATFLVTPDGKKVIRE